MPDYNLDPIASNLGRFIRNRDIFRPEEELIGGDRRFYSTAQIPEDVIIPTKEATAAPERSTPDLDKITESLRTNFKFNNEAQELLKQHLNTMPEKQRPSFARKLVASMAGAGGDFNKSEFVLNAPYYTNMADWRSKADILSNLAATESRMNRDEANAALQEITRQIQVARLGLDIQKNQQIYETKVAGLELNFQKAMNDLQFKYDQLTQQGATASNIAAFRQAQLEAMNARYAADLAIERQKVADLERYRQATLGQGAQRIGLEGRRVNLAEQPVTTREELEIDPKTGEPVAKVRTITRGETPRAAAKKGKTVRMIGKDGKAYQIPVEKEEEARDPNRGGFRYPRRGE